MFLDNIVQLFVICCSQLENLHGVKVYYSFYGLFESTTWQEAPDSAFAEFTKLQLQSYKIENVRLLNRKQYKISDLFPPVKWSKPQSKTATNQTTAISSETTVVFRLFPVPANPPINNDKISSSHLIRKLWRIDSGRGIESAIILRRGCDHRNNNNSNRKITISAKMCQCVGKHTIN
jgi:hypothetical protein